MSTVTIKMTGGLGNQLFQYAFGRAICADQHHLHIDVQWFTNNRSRSLGLNYFQIPDCVHILKHDRTFFDSFNRAPRFLKSLSSLAKICPKYIFESSFGFDANLLSVPHIDVIYEGYFQSHLYFSAIRNSLIQELTVRSEIKEGIALHPTGLSDHNSVCVHVRRGDYISNAVVNKVHGVCPIDYYKCAIRNIAQKIDNPFFYFFSDDMEWVKENLISTIRENTVIAGGGSEIADFELMKSCRHHIISNSTFSWWSAWLSDSKEKIVIAPKAWFADSNFDSSTMHPPEWISI